MLKKLANRIQSHFAKRKLFYSICKKHNLRLDYSSNISEINILKEVFVEEVYSKYLPKFKNAVIIDIGAHYGYFSIYASKNCDKSVKIIALEPSVTNSSMLKTNIRKNKINNARLLQNGLANENIIADLYESHTKANHSIFLNKGKSYKTQFITLKRLIEDEELTQIDFLKMDCEGSEYESLMNCDAQTLNKIKCISLEFHDIKSEKYNGETLKNFLENRGFKISTFEYSKSNFGMKFGKLVAI